MDVEHDLTLMLKGMTKLMIQSKNETTDRTTKAGKKEWIGLGILLLPTLVLMMDISVLFLATPHLYADLLPSNSQLLWIMDIYGFMITGFLMTMGTLGDRIGRRKLLMIGAVAFMIASLAAAFSTQPEMLIVSRALLGIAGSTLMPSALALITHMFRVPKQRTLAIAIWVNAMSVGIAIGPLIGGALLEHFWWGSVFLLGVPVMLLLIVTAPVFLPEYRDKNAGELNWISVILSLAFILPIVYGFKKLPESGVGWSVILPILIGLIMGVIFVRRQLFSPNPLVDVRLFHNRSFSVAFLFILFGMVAINGIEYLFPQYLQFVKQFSPLEAGLWTIPGALAVIAGSLIAPFLTRWMSPTYIIGLGAVISAIGFLMMSQVGSTLGFAELIIGLVAVQFGIAPIIVLGTDLIVGAAPPEKSGAASALSSTSGELGVALGIAIMGSVSTVVYRSKMPDLTPASVPPEKAQSIQDTINRAIIESKQLPAPLDDLVQDAARVAFTHGFHMAAILSAIIALGISILSVTLFQHIRSDSND